MSTVSCATGLFKSSEDGKINGLSLPPAEVRKLALQAAELIFEGKLDVSEMELPIIPR